MSEEVSFDSRDSTDKIVDVISGSYSASANVAGYLSQYAVAHPYGRPLATRLKWSTDNINWVDGGFSTREGDTSFLPSISHSDSNNVYILSGVVTGTVYYEIVCIWMDGYDASDPLVAPYAQPDSPLAFDSRLNYQKIHRQNTINTDGSSTQNITVPHNLGYEPNVWVYFESFSGDIYPAYGGGLANYFLYDFSNQAELTYHMDSTNLYLEYSGPAQLRKIHYRIYKL